MIAKHAALRESYAVESLAEYRKKHRISILDVSEVSGIPIALLRQWERWETAPDDETLIEWTLALIFLAGKT